MLNLPFRSRSIMYPWNDLSIAPSQSSPVDVALKIHMAIRPKSGHPGMTSARSSALTMARLSRLTLLRCRIPRATVSICVTVVHPITTECLDREYSGMAASVPSCLRTVARSVLSKLKRPKLRSRRGRSSALTIRKKAFQFPPRRPLARSDAGDAGLTQWKYELNSQISQ